MRIELEIKNYRCFPDNRPVRISLDHRFVSLIGANNAGKSTILRSFYELRQAFGKWLADTIFAATYDEAARKREVARTRGGDA